LNNNENINEIVPDFVENSYNNLFGGGQAPKQVNENEMSNGLVEMDFSQIKPFPGHIFKLYEGQRLEDMIESIKQFGIIFPIILWQTENNVYTILSGHNRVNAAKIAGLTKAPVVIKTDLTQDEAVLFVTETNLRQRSFTDLSHSERALCLSQHYEAMKCQGKRNDLIKEIERLIKPHSDSVQESSSQVGTRSNEKLGKDYGLSRNQVARYIRLATLNPTLLAYVDTGNIAFLAGYDISFIENQDIQTIISDKIKHKCYKVDMKMAKLLREYYKLNNLTEQKIEQIMSGESTRKPKSDKPKSFQVKAVTIGKHFTNGQSKAEIEEIIDKALSMYFSKQAKNS
jgi:ParB family chromosome partitioning protein